MHTLPASVDAMLLCATPPEWLAAAPRNLDTLLVDHANCEKKAAATAMNLMFRYGERLPDLQDGLAKLAREELRHFEQVTRIMRRRDVTYRPLSAARYAEGMRKHLRKREPERLTDLLVVGAFIEARSCERFRSLLPVLEEDLADFYRGLHAAEARHFQFYLGMAEKHGAGDVEARVEAIAAAEAELIQASDPLFRFHSGVPAD
jgi:tRNA-(ms[2]io[6]A)-hydroxylase